MVNDLVVTQQIVPVKSIEREAIVYILKISRTGCVNRCSQFKHTGRCDHRHYTDISFSTYGDLKSLDDRISNTIAYALLNQPKYDEYTFNSRLILSSIDLANKYLPDKFKIKLITEIDFNSQPSFLKQKFLRSIIRARKCEEKMIFIRQNIAYLRKKRKGLAGVHAAEVNKKIKRFKKELNDVVLKYRPVALNPINCLYYFSFKEQVISFLSQCSCEPHDREHLNNFCDFLKYFFEMTNTISFDSYIDEWCKRLLED